MQSKLMQKWFRVEDLVIAIGSAIRFMSLAAFRIFVSLDEAILNFGETIPAREEGTSPYDHIIKRHSYTQVYYSAGMAALAAIDDNAERPPWVEREAKPRGEQVVSEVWVKAADVRSALDAIRRPRPELSAHGFLGALKSQGAYLAVADA